MVTNGYVTEEGLDYLGPHINVWRIDLKGFDDETYRRFCHARSVAPVLAAAERAKRRWGMHVEVVTNVVPTINDDEDTLQKIAEWIVTALGPETPWHVTRFFPYLELSHLDPTSIESLVSARAIGRARGLHHVYIGNAQVAGGEDTVCPECGAVAIAREGYRITVRQLKDGACSSCGTGLGIVE
jgi:pyruvate formate lyase activating enzyme